MISNTNQRRDEGLETMSRVLDSGRCVLCLRATNSLTSDHVFPRSWYPKTTPSDIEKWQMPACHDCNQRYGQLESDLLLRVGLCLDPTDFKSLGISDRIHRSIDPAQAKNARDREHRRKRREKLLGELIPAVAVPREAIFPGFGPYAGTHPEDQIGIGLPAGALEALTNKIVRGITYVLDGNYIGTSHEIRVFLWDEITAAPFRMQLSRFGEHHHRGPGISVTRAVPHDDPISGMFEIQIWGRLTVWATVQPKLETALPRP